MTVCEQNLPRVPNNTYTIYIGIIGIKNVLLYMIIE